MSNQELSTTGNSALDRLRQNYPQHAEDNYEKIVFPQLRFKAKAVLDDNDKVVAKAGTFVRVVRSEELNADGKYDYNEVQVGTTLDMTVLYERYKLTYYDAADGSYVSSPVFDDKAEVTKLFQSGKEIAAGTSTELRALPQYAFEEDGKKKSKLQLLKVLYVFYDGALHETTLSRGNGYAFSNWKRDLSKDTGKIPAEVIVKVSSEKTEYGGNKYNQMVFKTGDTLSNEDLERNADLIDELRQGIAAEKAFYGQPVNTPDMTALPTGEGEDF